MSSKLPLIFSLFVVVACAAPSAYVLPERAAVAKLCHVFILNDFPNSRVSWMNPQSLRISGITWHGESPTLSSRGYAVYPAPMGSVQLKFDYVYKGMAYEGELSSEVRGTCKEGGVLFAYVQSRVVTSAKWPQGIIETSSKSRELAGPLASELLEIFRSNQTVIVGKLADYVLNGAKVDYHLKSASMERS